MAGALIGALRVSLSAETSAFEAGMKRSQRQAAATASSIKNSFAGVGASLKTGVAGLLGALSIGTFIQIGRAALEYAGSLAEVAQQLGVTSKDLQVFRFAAGQVGVKQEQLEVGLSKLTITLGKVAAGAKAPAAALHAIGVSADELKGKDTGEAFRIIADGLQNVTDRSQRAAIEVALFGKSGAALDNLLAGGSSAVNEFADAAAKLGLILSDEQIQNADKTADKIAALATVLKTRIAGIVADNASAIWELAEAFDGVARAASDAIIEIKRFDASYRSRNLERVGNTAEAARVRGSVFQSDKVESIAGQSVTLKLPPLPVAATPQGQDIEKYLAGGGGGHKARADHTAEKAARDAQQLDQEMLRAKTDILRSQENIATDYSDRASLSIQILDLERESYKSQLQYEVATKDKTQAQADSLLALYDQNDSIKRTGILNDEEEQRQKDFNELSQHDFDRKREVLEAQNGIAETSSERRKIELEILELAYEAKRQALQAIIDTSKDFKAIEDARRDLLNLNLTHAADRTAVIQNTRGPMEDFLASLPTTAAKANEALQQLEVDGFNGLIDSALALSEGLGSAADSLLATLKSFLLGLARMELQQGLASILQSNSGGIIGAISGIFGGGGSSYANIGSAVGSNLFHFGSGGSFNVMGLGGRDRNTLSLNGLPIANVSYGERISIGNDNHPMRGGGGARGGTVMNIYTPDADSFRRSEGQITRSWQRRLR